MLTKHTSLPFVVAISLAATLTTTAYCLFRLYHFSTTPKTKTIITPGAEHGEPNENDLVVESESPPPSEANDVRVDLAIRDHVIMTSGDSYDINLDLQSDPDDATLAKHHERLKNFFLPSTSPLSVHTIRVSVSESVDQWNADNLSKFGPMLFILERLGPQITTLVVQLRKSPVISTQETPLIPLYSPRWNVTTVTWESHRNQLPLLLNPDPLSEDPPLRLTTLSLHCEITDRDCAFLLYEFKESLVHFHVNYILHVPRGKLEEIPRITLPDNHEVWRNLRSKDRPKMQELTSMRLHTNSDLIDLLNRFYFPRLTEFWLLRPGDTPETQSHFKYIRSDFPDLPWGNIPDDRTNTRPHPPGARRRAESYPFASDSP
ncbi:hypothetical protein H0H92_005106 [Tricholoma furcatifolium]|nr:hypothetical protein H0H92_005106 [Tricholoma furcatifolium]